MKTLSISVAAYNLGEMVLTNLKSVCESNVAEDIEIIVTDDGSKDNTPDIVEQYAKNYPTVVKLIRKNNEGPGSTVNSGIKNATGKYFRMVDGDDWVDTNHLEQFIQLLKNTNADLVVSDFVYYDNSKQNYLNVISSKMPANIEMDIDDVYSFVPLFMHSLTFKTEIFKKNNIILDNCFYTDVEYTLFPIPYIKSVIYFDNIIYVYRIAREGQSVSVDSMKKNIGQHNLVLTHLLDWYNKLKDLSIGQDGIINKRIFNMTFIQLNTLCSFDANKQNKKNIKDYLHYISQSNSSIYKQLKKTKKCKILLWSGFSLYWLVVYITKKRNK